MGRNFVHPPKNVDTFTFAQAAYLASFFLFLFKSVRFILNGLNFLVLPEKNRFRLGFR